MMEPLHELIQTDWKKLLHDEFSKEYFVKLQQFVEQEYNERTIFPPQEEIFTALNLTSFEQVKVVILGQDPYHGRGEAHGLSFSVKPGIAIPKSLNNMLRELEEDLGCQRPFSGDLSSWAKQGVLLLNTVLTVREKAANSHKGKGWEVFTDTIIELLAKRQKSIVFILWGRQAQEKKRIIAQYAQHVILESPHPSPLSAHRGFFGSKPYSRANEVLQASGQEPIQWCLSIF